MTLGRAGAALLSLVACQPVDGEIFSGMSTVSESGGLTSEGVVDGSGGMIPFGCAPEGPVWLNADDPLLSHDCGEDCDSDWCGCEPCRVVYGPIGRPQPGPMQLRINGGASGLIEYDVTLRLESGEVLAQHTVSYDGLFQDVAPVDIPDGCAIVEIEIEQLTGLCSRIYEVVIEPR